MSTKSKIILVIAFTSVAVGAHCDDLTNATLKQAGIFATGSNAPGSRWITTWTNLTVKKHCPPWGCSGEEVFVPARNPKADAALTALRQFDDRLHVKRVEERMRQVNYPETYRVSFSGPTNVTVR